MYGSALLVASGCLCCVVACIHGYLGHAHVIGRATFTNDQMRQLADAMWQLTTVTWVASGAVIAASPWISDDKTRPWVVGAACLPLIYGLIGNAWITHGKNPGWMAMTVVVALALIGLR
jgi:hypothetical protein